MKLLYFTLAAAASASLEREISQFVEDAINEIYQEKPYGQGHILNLQPYYYEDVTNGQNSWTKEQKWSADGINFDNQVTAVSWDDSSFNVNQQASGFMANNEMWRWANPDIFAVGYNQFDKEFNMSGKCNGFEDPSNMSFDLSWDMENNLDQEAFVKGEGGLSFDLNTDDNGNSSIDLQINDNTKTDGFPEWISDPIVFDRDFELTAESKLSVAKCESFFADQFLSNSAKSSCVISNSYNWVDNYNDDKEGGDLSIEFYNKFIALLAKTDDDYDYSGFVVRGENKNHGGALIGKQEFMGLYAVDTRKFRPQIAKGNADLIVRVPGVATISDELVPMVEKKLEPFGEFIEACVEDFERLPNLVYHFDSFLKTFDNEFDFSKIAAASHFAFNGMSNDDLQAGFKDMSDDIIDMINDESITEGFEEMRENVEWLASKQSYQAYKGKFGKIFSRN